MFCSSLDFDAILFFSLLPKSPTPIISFLSTNPLLKNSKPQTQSSSSSMAAAAAAVSQTPKTQTPGPEPEPEPANPNKSLLLTHFAYKACLVTVFLVLVPLFPSLAPEFMNQNLHARSWEVLQLVFVGIAVSYGLFSKKNDQHHKDYNNSPNAAQSYVSKLLQVSSVFDEDSETALVEENSNSKFQTLNSSQYYRGQPPVVSEITQKPLLLPVRSLKQRLPETTPDGLGLAENELNGKKGENVVVLPSPIPWRSRSGRNENGSVRSENLSPSPSIRRLSPSTSVSPVRKKGLAAAPPPPPPPPPQIRRKSTLVKSNSSVPDSRDKEALRRIVSSVAESDLISKSRGGTLDSGANSVRTFRSTDLNWEKPNEEEKNEINDKVLMESTDDDDSEDEFMEGRSDNDGGPDVDKKADEFIAKFREQIRQQRIESIRRSTAQRTAAGNKMNST